ncbi:hypothetical protein SNE26_22510 [Mucilaginibacter sp. cycad4]|uniref:hypothetical protein n=1 Tax=Mucilaginibacter sp. cycad4 TaxID=3342096 RepID=UPI002AABAF7D|nr:hypothetical protein [Mucilaginibacter gossypii]WPU98791.1 hypothetical protein SNE26_22510 [Mucilaginibacter gossypii]
MYLTNWEASLPHKEAPSKSPPEGETFSICIFFKPSLPGRVGWGFSPEAYLPTKERSKTIRYKKQENEGERHKMARVRKQEKDGKLNDKSYYIPKQKCAGPTKKRAGEYGPWGEAFFCLDLFAKLFCFVDAHGLAPLGFWLLFHQEKVTGLRGQERTM